MDDMFLEITTGSKSSEGSRNPAAATSHMFVPDPFLQGGFREPTWYLSTGPLGWPVVDRAIGFYYVSCWTRHLSCRTRASLCHRGQSEQVECSGTGFGAIDMRQLSKRPAAPNSKRCTRIAATNWWPLLLSACIMMHERTGGLR